MVFALFRFFGGKKDGARLASLINIVYKRARKTVSPEAVAIIIPQNSKVVKRRRINERKKFFASADTEDISRTMKGKFLRSV